MVKMKGAELRTSFISFIKIKRNIEWFGLGKMDGNGETDEERKRETTQTQYYLRRRKH